jgi:hypothetical protein
MGRIIAHRAVPPLDGACTAFFIGEQIVGILKNDADLAEGFDERFPLPEGMHVPMPRFGRAAPPKAQRLPTRGLQAPPASLQWFDEDLRIRVSVRYETEKVWVDVESDDPAIAGKSVSAALVSEKGNRFIGQLIPLEMGPNEHCTGKFLFGTLDEVRDRLGSEAVTLDVFLME